MTSVDPITNLPITEDQRHALERAIRVAYFAALRATPWPDREEALNLKHVAAVLGLPEYVAPTGALAIR